ncbi:MULTISPECIES: hypothetical protein [unclassified Bordetella]|uniref:hypothetical protein n=1 Tax=unclassified Bordetella TaxID=2630031 RepID=UPI0013271642|nr:MULTISPECIES: hypothetical protein [unclassified Bordetella]MVW72998.1 hypothetical protein [Bordetella sp. 15P40C-2]MVW79639.1 hypothetical protein [Bordetella sp. 02P26C-1]
MAVVYGDFVRERGRGGRTIRTYRAKTQRAKAYQRATATVVHRAQAATPARRGGAAFWMIMLLAPLAGLAAPLVAVPALGQTGWVLAGAGLLACMLLLLRLAKHEADYAYQAQQQ